VTSLVDVAPTLAELTGAPALPAATGRSLVPWLAAGDATPGAAGADGAGGPPDWPDEALAEVVPGLGSPPARMVRRGRWKLVLHEGYAAPQLFDLQRDPGELADRGTDPACAAVREELLALARRDWSGQRIASELRRRSAAQAVLAAWYRAQRPPDPDYWSIAPEYNRFPEPLPAPPPPPGPRGPSR
jgi:arylsulfatase A-like enzyme